MTHEYAREYLQNIVDLYRSKSRIHPLIISPMDIAALEVTIEALRQQEELEDDGR